MEVPIGGGRDFYPDLAEVGKDFIEDEGICYDYAYPLESSWGRCMATIPTFEKILLRQKTEMPVTQDYL